MDKNVIWRDIPGYIGYYQASNTGDIRSVDRVVRCRNGYGVKKGVVLKQYLKGEYTKYLYVYLQKNGEKEMMAVSRLVALTFPEICGVCFEGAEANHINENVLDNRAENINWLSHIDNIRYGNHCKNVSISNTNNPKRSIKINQYNKNGVLIKQWPSQKEIQRTLGYYQTAISACCTGKRKTHKGFIWSFA